MLVFIKCQRTDPFKTTIITSPYHFRAFQAQMVDFVEPLLLQFYWSSLRTIGLSSQYWHSIMRCCMWSRPNNFMTYFIMGLGITTCMQTMKILLLELVCSWFVVYWSSHQILSMVSWMFAVPYLDNMTMVPLLWLGLNFNHWLAANMCGDIKIKFL